MTRRARAFLAALALGWAGCGYYAPPIRPQPDRDAVAAPDDAGTAGDDAVREEGDD